MKIGARFRDAIRRAHASDARWGSETRLRRNVIRVGQKRPSHARFCLTVFSPTRQGPLENTVRNIVKCVGCYEAGKQPIKANRLKIRRLSKSGARLTMDGGSSTNHQQPSTFPTLFPSKALQTIPRPYSHSIVPSHRKALNYQRKFLLLAVRSRHPDRQFSSLLILKENLRDPNFSRFRPLSLSIGRFLNRRPNIAGTEREQKYRQHR